MGAGYPIGRPWDHPAHGGLVVGGGATAGGAGEQGPRSYVVGVEVPYGARVGDLVARIMAPGVLPVVPGGATWVLVDSRTREEVCLLGTDGPLFPRSLDRPLADGPHHLTVHPGIGAREVWDTAPDTARMDGTWDGPGVRPPRPPDTVRVCLTRRSVTMGDDALAPHHRTADLPVGATELDLAAWVLGHYGASVRGGSVWLLEMGGERGRPAAVLVMGDPSSTTGLQSDSTFMVGPRRRVLPDECDAHLDYHRHDDPVVVLQRARARSTPEP